MFLLSHRECELPTTITLILVGFRVKCDVENKVITSLTPLSGFDQSPVKLHTTKQPKLGLRGIKDLSHPTLTILRNDFHWLNNFNYEVQNLCFNDPSSAINACLRQGDATHLTLIEPFVARRVHCLDDIIDMFKEFFDAGLILESYLIDEEEYRVMYQQQGIFRCVDSKPVVSINGEIWTLNRLVPATRALFAGERSYFTMRPLTKNSEVVILNDACFGTTDTSQVLESCPACGDLIHLKDHKPVCINPDCDTVVKAIAETLAQQTRLNISTILNAIQLDEPITYLNCNADDKEFQTLGVDLFKALMDISGKEALSDVITYLYPMVNDTPFNVTLEHLNHVLQKYLISSKVDDGLHALLNESRPKLRVMLLGEIPQQEEFALSLMLISLGIEQTACVDETAFIIAGDIKDHIDDEFFGFINESRNIYTYYINGNIKPLLNQLKNLKDIHYLSD